MVDHWRWCILGQTEFEEVTYSTDAGATFVTASTGDTHTRSQKKIVHILGHNVQLPQQLHSKDHSRAAASVYTVASEVLMHDRFGFKSSLFHMLTLRLCDPLTLDPTVILPWRWERRRVTLKVQRNELHGLRGRCQQSTTMAPARVSQKGNTTGHTQVSQRKHV